MSESDWASLSRAMRAAQRQRERRAAQKYTAVTLPDTQLSSAGQSDTKGASAMATTRKKNDPLAMFDSFGGQEVESASEFWKPEEVGDMLVGVYVAKRDDGKYGPVARIQTADGDLIPVGLSKQLEDLLPGTFVGKPVAIQMIDEKNTGKQNAMKVYRVKVLDDVTWERLQNDDLPF